MSGAATGQPGYGHLCLRAFAIVDEWAIEGFGALGTHGYFGFRAIEDLTHFLNQARHHGLAAACFSQYIGVGEQTRVIAITLIHKLIVNVGQFKLRDVIALLLQHP